MRSIMAVLVGGVVLAALYLYWPGGKHESRNDRLQAPVPAQQTHTASLAKQAAEDMVPARVKSVAAADGPDKQTAPIDNLRDIDAVIANKLDEVNEVSQRLRNCTSIKDKMEVFGITYDDRVLQWPAYSDFTIQAKPALVAQYEKNGKLDVDTMISDGRNLLREFWRNFGNPSACEKAYKAKLMAEMILTVDPMREDAYVLAEQALLCIAVRKSPLLKRTDPHYNQAFAEFNAKFSDELRHISILHFARLICKKPIESITAYDLSVVNHILEVRSSPIDYDICKNTPEVEAFFSIGQSVTDKMQIDYSVRRKCLMWIKSVVTQRNWRNHMRNIDDYLKALDERQPIESLPSYFVYSSATPAADEQAWYIILMYNSRYDGLLVEGYHGYPAFVPVHDAPEDSEKEYQIKKDLSRMLRK